MDHSARLFLVSRGEPVEEVDPADIKATWRASGELNRQTHIAAGAGAVQHKWQAEKRSGGRVSRLRFLLKLLRT